MFANGLSAPQHSTYFVILEDGLERDGKPPGVAIPGERRLSKFEMDIFLISENMLLEDLRRSAKLIKP